MRSSRLVQGIVMGLILGVAALGARGALAQSGALTGKTASGTAIREWVDGVPDTGQFLADSVVLATVAGRRITAGQFRNDYFDVYAPVRPKTDSTGRVEFLNTLVDKVVLGEVVKSLPFAPGFEQRATLREYRERVLSNVLFQRAVLDSCTPTDRDLRAFYEKMKQEVRIQRIRLMSPTHAERVRSDLVSGRTTWRRAVSEHSAEKLADPDGDIGWANLYGLPEPLASMIADLKVNGITPPVRTTDGYFLFRRVGTRPFSPPSFEGIEKTLFIRLKNHMISVRSDTLQRRLMVQRKLEIDTANVRFAASVYQPHVTSERKDSGVNAVSINVDIPHFEPADNERVLVRWPGGEYKLGQFNHTLAEMNPVTRPPVHEPDLLADQAAMYALEPFRAEMAAQLGYERDSMAVAMLDARVEQFKVEAMIEDSVMSRVIVTDAERRAYYKAHPREYTSFPRVRFAAFATETKGEGDSLATAIRAGTKPEAILLADSLAGIKRGSIQSRLRNEPGPFTKLLFEEMRPGQVTVEGPLSDKSFVVIQLLEFDSGQLLPFEQVIEYVDNHVRSAKEEEQYQRFLQRQRAKMEITMHRELLPRVKLVAPEI